MTSKAEWLLAHVKESGAQVRQARQAQEGTYEAFLQTHIEGPSALPALSSQYQGVYLKALN